MTVLPRGVGLPRGRLEYANGVQLRFGLLTIGFRGADESVRFSIEETHQPFVVGADAQPDLELACRIAPIVPPAEPIALSRGGAWDLRRTMDGGEDVVFRGGPDFGTDIWHLHLEPAFQRGSLIEAPVLPARTVRADGYPLLEYLVVRLLGRRDGLLLHASTAIVDDRAYVFVGHSGAGKSTMAAIAEASGARIPTDDRTILTAGSEGIMAWGTPWHGSLVRKTPEGAAVRGLFLLQQAAENRTEPLPPTVAAKELFVRLIQPRIDPMEVQGALRLLERIVDRVPVSVLHFRPTKSAFELAVAAAG